MESTIPRERGIFCNRTLNLRSIQAIGYDMDYTLIHYYVEEWEARAYHYIKQRLLDDGWPVESLDFDPQMVTRGLVFDKEEGNIVKANRFGYIKRAMHGTRPLEFSQMRKTYSQTLVDLAQPRYSFLNTLFALSEGCIFAQLVDLFDAGALSSVLTYHDLYDRVRHAVDTAHLEGELKGDIIADPEHFVDLDPQLPLTLLDQRHAGKRLLLITNSDWAYTRPIMSYTFDRFLPQGQTWRDLFDLVIVSARKPSFFSGDAPAFEVVSEDGLLRPNVGPLELGKTYVGGNASLLETSLGLFGDGFLYVGDHIYADVNVSKKLLSWRSVLILRELEQEVALLASAQDDRRQITTLMAQKESLEAQLSTLRLQIQRQTQGYDPSSPEKEPTPQPKESSPATEKPGAQAEEPGRSQGPTSQAKAPPSAIEKSSAQPQNPTPQPKAPPSATKESTSQTKEPLLQAEEPISPTEAPPLAAEKSPPAVKRSTPQADPTLQEQISALREEIVALDNQIAPFASRDGRSFNPTWGYLMRTGNDKSHLTRQIEKYADLYTSRVSNFLLYTPFMFFRSPRGSLPHDPLP